MIGVARDGALWTVTLNRPEKANSLTRAMLVELEGVFAAAAREGAKALILTGAGKVFSAGADLDEARAGLATDPIWTQLSDRVAGSPFLTVCAMNGTLAGGAMGMALACDLRISVPDAKVFYPVMKLGFLPQPADPGRLVTLVGPARAKMILMAGVRVAADEARDWGLIDRLAEPAALMDTARTLCADVLAAEAGHVAAIKRMAG
ncbi:MAG: enoyl-CoA hydratase/isomerase family protein [Paracoccaceae bacterium]